MILVEFHRHKKTLEVAQLWRRHVQLKIHNSVLLCSYTCKSEIMPIVLYVHSIISGCSPILRVNDNTKWSRSVSGVDNHPSVGVDKVIDLYFLLCSISPVQFTVYPIPRYVPYMWKNIAKSGKYYCICVCVCVCVCVCSGGFIQQGGFSHWCAKRSWKFLGCHAHFWSRKSPNWIPLFGLPRPLLVTQKSELNTSHARSNSRPSQTSGDQ